ncbi:MAG: hypothetical protein R3C19_25880 [Planctomycetaceae bacterium]
MSYIEVRDLVKHFPVHGGVLNKVVNTVQAVSGVSLQIEKEKLWASSANPGAANRRSAR